MEPFYTEELEEIRNKLILMADRSVEIVNLSVEAIKHVDKTLAQRVLGLDDEIDGLEVSVDAECVRYLSLRAPVVMDVRLIAFAMRASQDLERVADEACSIARRVRNLAKADHGIAKCQSLPAMGQKVLGQLQMSIDSFLGTDVEKAYEVIKNDDCIDELHRDHFKILTGDSAENIAEAVDLLFISKSLERVGDHAANLAEEVIYLIKADDVRHAIK